MLRLVFWSFRRGGAYICALYTASRVMSQAVDCAFRTYSASRDARGGYSETRAWQMTTTESRSTTGMVKTPQEVMRFAQESGVRMVDVKFTDMPGTWQHFSIPMSSFNISAFNEGIGFDGSSIRGFQEINESDMLLLPDPTTAILDPFTAVPTLSLICDVAQPGELSSYSRDPRYIARKAEAYLKSTGIADTAYFGPEAEFFVFDEVRF